MVVTESMTPNTKGQPADQKRPRWGRLGLGSWPEAIAAAAAVLTLVGTAVNELGGWDWLPGRKPAAAPATSSVPPAAPPLKPVTESSSAGPAAAPAAGVPLDSLAPVAGRTIPLPAGLDRTRYPHAVAVGCPSNQTGDGATVLEYQLYGRYRTLTGTLTGWSAGNQPFRVQLRVVTGTKQPDDQIQSEQRPPVTAVVNGASVPVRADVAASGDAGRDGRGADEIELRFLCEHPHDAVILSDALLG
jgi:hypothetical protein